MLDNKQKVLVAIYTEYQKDVPDMRNAITAPKIGVERDVFLMALIKLENESLITIGTEPLYGGDGAVPVDIYTGSIKITVRGIQYVETALNIEPTLTNQDKVRTVEKKSLEWGIDQLKDFAAKVLAEILKG